VMGFSSAPLCELTAGSTSRRQPQPALPPTRQSINRRACQALRSGDRNPKRPGSPASDACERALAAATEARRRLAAFEDQLDQKRLGFGIGLHLGEVIYGNVGIPSRLQFTLVGPAVNEVARVERMTKTLGVPLIATAAFTSQLRCKCRSLGEHDLRGIGKPTELFTLLPAD
jgi:class 3 adenylate cyclase